MRLLCDRQWSLVVRVRLGGVGQSTSLTAHCTFARWLADAVGEPALALTLTFACPHADTGEAARPGEAGRGDT